MESVAVKSDFAQNDAVIASPWVVFFFEYSFKFLIIYWVEEKYYLGVSENGVELRERFESLKNLTNPNIFTKTQTRSFGFLNTLNILIMC